MNISSQIIYRLRFAALVTVFLLPIVSSANTGTILSNENAAWSNEIGWVNFAPTNGGLTITDSAVTGSVWSENYGWINFTPTNGGVTNDGQGHLSGSVWGDNLGWIDFSGVTIDTTTGKFSGTATGAVVGTLTFDCAECDVTTDWRPTTASSSSTSTPPSGGGGGGGGAPGAGGTTGGSPSPTPSPEPTPTPAPTPEPTPTPEPAPTPEPTPTPTPEPTPEPAPTTPPAESSGSGIISTIGGSISSVGSFVVSAVSGLTNAVETVYNNAPVAVKDTVINTKKFVQTKTGSAVTKTISTVGVATGISLPVATAATSFSDLWLIIGRMFGFFLEIFGLRRKSRPWGTVYDSITKRPLDPAYVSLVNVETDKEVASAITDFDGRYGFIASPGTYRIIAEKTDYATPSIKMKGKSFDEVYNDLYFGGPIVIADENTTITKNIPMDPVSFNWNEFTKTKMNVNKFIRARDITWARISRSMFVIGGLMALVAVLVVPEPYNLIVAGLYLLAYILNYVVFPRKKSGVLTEKSTRMPLSFAIIEIFSEGESEPIMKKIADAFGAYYALVPNGRYYMRVSKKNDDESYTAVFQTPVMNITKGIINADLKG